MFSGRDVYDLALTHKFALVAYVRSRSSRMYDGHHQLGMHTCACQARPMSADDGLEDIRWIHGQGGERLPAASYALLPKSEKKVCFCHRRGIANFCGLFSTHHG